MSLWWRCLPMAMPSWRAHLKPNSIVALNCIHLLGGPHEIRPRNRQGAGAIAADARRGVLPSECHLRG
ncbi:hypothetical protein FIBSPDRAFT_877885 [Athelia psychrophila]|uniref:Uncharacterized protein n=1 Tax=Athelia psychrophila TaxID=1759441 RepID=A0A167VK60_9AGAM|nr:hypothetical protein FIBSPDRAFT_877885 [Fibularhizoctonia sp. CBS 109695]